MRFYQLAFIMLLTACTTQPDTVIQKTGDHPPIKSGIWRFSFQLGKEELPFNVSISGYDGAMETFAILNGSEKIEAKKIFLKDDSIFIELPVFASELRGRIESNNLITGKWINKSKKNYTIPFIGEANKPYLFTPTKITTKVSHRYHAVFDENSEDAWNAILVLSEDSNRVEATFLTETGDYRYLQGNVINNKLELSTFDGSHAFLFTAEIKGDSLLNGTFTSGIHYQGTWAAIADSSFNLRDPEKLTYLKPGFDKIDFSLPNENGDTLTWEDMDLDGKVVILDIMGSWCPNCMDANRALEELTQKYSIDELVVIPIAYETTADFNLAKERVTKMQTDLGMPSHFLFGGLAKTENAASDFPMLNGIMSFPTLIFVGKDRKVQEIYTGFYGPSTGKYYNQFMHHTDSLLNRMVDATG